LYGFITYKSRKILATVYAFIPLAQDADEDVESRERPAHHREGRLMPKKKVPGRGRLDLRASPALLDLADRTARKLGLDLSGYIRLAITERLKRDGEVPPDPNPPPVAEPEPPKPKRPRGRPRKEKGE
jgi:hypothetical protein